jgi:hypothetical protein
VSAESLMSLVERIIDTRDSGSDPSALLDEFEAAVPYPNARELFISDQGASYILARAQGFRRIEPGDSQRAELEELIARIRRFEGGEVGVDIAEDILRASVPHPDVSKLVWDASLKEKDVVDAALGYQGITL